jgi:hypothetical protein
MTYARPQEKWARRTLRRSDADAQEATALQSGSVGVYDTRRAEREEDVSKIPTLRAKAA